MSIVCVIPYLASVNPRGDEPLIRGPEDKATRRDPSRSHHGSVVPVQCQQTFEALLGVLTVFTPRVEPGDLRLSATGHRPSAACYLELGDVEWAVAVEEVQEIGRAVRERVGLSPAIGLAGGKFPAWVAAAAVKPNEALLVVPDREADFLSPFPVALLPLDAEMARRLRLLGLRTLGQLAALPAGAVLTQLGKGGRLLHRLARGRDDRPVVPRRPRAVERVARQFDDPVADRAILQAVAQAMAGELAARLQTRGRIGREMRVVLHLEDSTARSEQLALRRPAPGAEQIARALAQLLGRLRVPCGVVGLEVTMADLTPATGQQLDLFLHRTGQESRLRTALQGLLTRYGSDCFHRVSLTNRDARLPEQRFRLREVDAS